MSSSIQPDPSMIGGVPKAPFVRLPDPSSLFARRAGRFRTLCTTEGKTHLAPYLLFLAAIADAQTAVLSVLPQPSLPDAAALGRARQFAMPPLDRGGLKSDDALRATFAALFRACAEIDKPSAAEAALTHVRGLTDAEREPIVADVLANSAASGEPAEHAYVAAALQVHFARLAAALTEGAPTPVDVGVCPVCGGPPVVSIVAGWYGAEGARYASCMLCSTLWNEVRVKCLACGSTKGVGYQEIDGLGGNIKAETCDACGSYIKILYQNKDPTLDPVADDVASLGLDLLLRERGTYRRAGVNPFLLGY